MQETLKCSRILPTVLHHAAHVAQHPGSNSKLLASWVAAPSSPCGSTQWCPSGTSWHPAFNWWEAAARITLCRFAKCPTPADSYDRSQSRYVERKHPCGKWRRSGNDRPDSIEGEWPQTALSKQDASSESWLVRRWGSFSLDRLGAGGIKGVNLDLGRSPSKCRFSKPLQRLT